MFSEITTLQTLEGVVISLLHFIFSALTLMIILRNPRIN